MINIDTTILGYQGKTYGTRVSQFINYAMVGFYPGGGGGVLT